MKRVLIVCTANKIRSPMAMEIANRLAKQRNLPYSFKCGGIAIIGDVLENNVITVLSEIGINTIYTPTHIGQYNVASFDEIHVMNERQKATMLSLYGNILSAENIIILNVENPYGKGIDAYRQCRDEILRFYEEYIV